MVNKEPGPAVLRRVMMTAHINGPYDRPLWVYLRQEGLGSR